MITLKQVSSINQADPNLRDAHAKEVGVEKISVNTELYKKAEKVVFIKDNVQIGYMAFYIHRHADIDEQVFQDVSYYIHPKYRGYMRSIFNSIKELAKSKGCGSMKIHCVTERQVTVFSKMGYGLDSYMMSKKL